jgi:uncharacterized protein
MPSKFEVKKDKSGKFRFNLIAANGEVVASSEAYATEEACRDGIQSVRSNAPSAEIVETTSGRQISPPTALKRQISVGTILIVVIAFSAGVASGSFLSSLAPQPPVISFTRTVTVPTTVPATVPTILTSTAQVTVSTASSIISSTGISSISSSSTSTSQFQSSASQRPKWISSDANVISWSQAASYAGQSRTVEGTIVYTYKSGTNVFLDFRYPYQGYFYAYIPSPSGFGFAPESFYKNKEVRVTGLIQMYQGAPEIIVNSPSQIEVAYMGFNYP